MNRIALWCNGLLALTLVSCAARVIPPPTPEGPPTAENLLGTEWRLRDLMGGGVIATTEPTVSFPQPGTIAGNGSCNRFTGAVEIGSDTMRIGTLAATSRACAGAVMSQEAKYLAALETIQRATFEGRFLMLYPKGTQPPLRFVRVEVKPAN